MDIQAISEALKLTTVAENQSRATSYLEEVFYFFLYLFNFY